jgi:hypothetical protein
LEGAAPALSAVEPKAFLADKAYDADALIGTLEQRGIVPVIPPKANRVEPRELPRQLHIRNFGIGPGDLATKKDGMGVGHRGFLALGYICLFRKTWWRARGLNPSGVVFKKGSINNNVQSYHACLYSCGGI